MARARRALLALILASVGFASSAATAADLRIGLLTEPTSLDPHFHNLTPNDSALSHIYERLVMPDEKGELHPALAESWARIDDTTWRFNLRPNVLWHDGKPFTAADVLFTFERAPNVPGSPSNYASAIKGRLVRKVDDLTIDIITAAPDPLLLNNLARVMIVSRANGRAAKTDDYNTGKAAIGTGPYKVTEFVRGEKLIVARNDAYWRGQPQWDRVILRPIADDQARVAALVSGDVDLIEDVPTAALARLKEDPKVEVVQAVSQRVIYLHMDQFRDTTQYITGKDGAPLANPLLDKRVRLALSKAINRDAIVARVMGGAAIPANCVFRGAGALVTYPNILTAIPNFPTGIAVDGNLPNRLRTDGYRAPWAGHRRNPEHTADASSRDLPPGPTERLCLEVRKRGFEFPAYELKWVTTRAVDERAELVIRPRVPEPRWEVRGHFGI